MSEDGTEVQVAHTAPVRPCVRALTLCNMSSLCTSLACTCNHTNLHDGALLLLRRRPLQQHCGAPRGARHRGCHRDLQRVAAGARRSGRVHHHGPPANDRCTVQQDTTRHNNRGDPHKHQVHCGVCFARSTFFKEFETEEEKAKALSSFKNSVKSLGQRRQQTTEQKRNALVVPPTRPLLLASNWPSQGRRTRS